MQQTVHSVFDNPLKSSIRNILLQKPEGLSEYDLIERLCEEGDFFRLVDKVADGGDDRGNEVILFQKHFLVMNALYQLQTCLLEEKAGYLSISPLMIKIEPSIDCGDDTLPSSGPDAQLRAYYLDWEKYEQTTRADVNALLDAFWQRYFASEKRVDALTTLGLSEEVDWDSIQLAYRRLIARHHPDKGGDQSLFVEIKRAHEVLSYCYKES